MAEAEAEEETLSDLCCSLPPAREDEWPPELQLPPPPPPTPGVDVGPSRAPVSASSPLLEMDDDSQFLGSIMAAAAGDADVGVDAGADAAEAEAGCNDPVSLSPQLPPPPSVELTAAPQVKEPEIAERSTAVAASTRKRGRPAKSKGRSDGGGAAKAVPRAASARRAAAAADEEVVCFICFDGGDLVVCDRRGCPKVYHPACVKRDASFFRSRSKWNCGWHICSNCEKAAYYMCYTCTYSVCKGCIKAAKFFAVRANKGFCETCFGTIKLIEAKDENDGKIGVDFDDKYSWEYLFKLYWLDVKGKLSLTFDELTKAKSRWNCPKSTSCKDESSDDLYDANNDQDASSDSFSGHRKKINAARKKKIKGVPKRCSYVNASKKKLEVPTKNSVVSNNEVESTQLSASDETRWASQPLLDLVGHMRGGDRSFMSQFDVQALLLEYIKENSLRDPRRKSQIICDARLLKLFGKPRVGHFEMLKLLESHFLVKEHSQIGSNEKADRNLDLELNGNDECGAMEAIICSDKKRGRQVKGEANDADEYAAVDVHNIKLIYLRRNLMEELISDAGAFSENVIGSFVRIKISGTGQKQDMYRLVKVIGTQKAADSYNVGKKTTDIKLEILNLDKKEVVTIDAISNQDFTEEECKRLRQSIKCGLIARLKVGDIREKARIFQSVRVHDWMENEKLRLTHLRDRASETGRRKELRECVEKLQLLSRPEEQARRINEVPDIHVDPHMNPEYESAEELDDKKDHKVRKSLQTVPHKKARLYQSVKVGSIPKNNWIIGQKISNSRHPNKSVVTEGSGAKKVKNDIGNSQHVNGWDSPTPSSNPCSLETSVGPKQEGKATLPTGYANVTSSEKVWHYKDPSGNDQGPFSLMQLVRWMNYFPPDMRIWLTSDKHENSLLLTDVLRCHKVSVKQEGQQNNFLLPTCHVGGPPSGNLNWGNSEHNGSSWHIAQSTPGGHNTAYPSQLMGPSMNYAARRPEGTAFGAHMHNNVGPFVASPFPVNPYRPHHGGGSHGYDFGDWKHVHGSENVWSPTRPPVLPAEESYGKRNSNWHVSDQQYKVSENRQPRPANAPNTKWGNDSYNLSAASPRGVAIDMASVAMKQAPEEEHQSSVASVQCKNNAVASAEDWSPSTASNMPNQSDRAPSMASCSAPSASPSDASKPEETMEAKANELGASDTLGDQSAATSCIAISEDCRDFERDYPSPTPKSEKQDPAPDVFAEKVCSPLEVAPALQRCDAPTSHLETTVPNLELNNPEDKDSVAETEQIPAEDHKSTDPVSVTNPAVEQNASSSNLPSIPDFEDFVPATAGDESPIPLSPFCENSYYQTEPVHSPVWDVRDDPASNIWSLPSPTPVPEPSSGYEAEDRTGTVETNEAEATKPIMDVSVLLTAEMDEALEKVKVESVVTLEKEQGNAEEVEQSNASVCHDAVADSSTVVSGGQSSAPPPEVVCGTVVSDGQLLTPEPVGGTVVSGVLLLNTAAVNPSSKSEKTISVTSSSSETVLPSKMDSSALPSNHANKSWPHFAGSGSLASSSITTNHSSTHTSAAASAVPAPVNGWHGLAGRADWGSAGASRRHYNDPWNHCGGGGGGGGGGYARKLAGGYGGASGGMSMSKPGLRPQQQQRGLCKFHENGYCKKGAKCNFLHQ